MHMAHTASQNRVVCQPGKDFSGLGLAYMVIGIGYLVVAST
jgi:hypothetical protein